MGSRKPINVQAGFAGGIVWDHRIVLQANLLLQWLWIEAQGGAPIKVNESPATALGCGVKIVPKVTEQAVLQLEQLFAAGGSAHGFSIVQRMGKFAGLQNSQAVKGEL
jgi:hypothetical protein